MRLQLLTTIPVAPGCADATLLARVAALTRAAYASADPLPGLPVADGARQTAASLRGFLDRGGWLWTTCDADGRLVAAGRTAVSGGAWHVSRIAVAPGCRGAGLAGRLLAAVEARAAAAGVRAIRLDAVAERCLPPLYAGLGYQITEHWAAPDKPLTEVTMERDPAALRRPQPPYPGPGAHPEITGVICWLIGDRGLSAMALAGRPPLRAAGIHCAAVLADRQARLAGVDVWRGRRCELGAVLARMPGARPAGGGIAAARFCPDRRDVRPHLMPRAHHPDLWAALRFRPGSEPLPAAIPAWPGEPGSR